MRLKINYGTEVGVFPVSCSEHVKRASVCDMRVLWMVCAHGGNVELSELCAFASANEDDVISSLSYWRGAGVISADGVAEPNQEADIHMSGSDESDTSVKSSQAPSDKPSTEQGKGGKRLKSADGLPIYTSEELTCLLEQDMDYEKFIGECQRIMGKMFSIHEVGVLVGLIDYLGLDFEYVMILLTYCVSHGKKTLHYVEKTAFGLYDSGVTGTEELTAELRRREAAASAEGQIRKIFGIGTRTLTTKEKKEISTWINVFGFSFDIIQKAYEVTADATGGTSLHYANSVLERWHSEGLTTLESIEEAEARYVSERAAETAGKAKSKKQKAGGAPKQGQGDGSDSSFDTDEFFNAAVRRSLGGQDK